MLSLRVHKHLRTSRRGFTLVEMLVVVPIALLVVAGLVSAMVTMIGDALVANATSDVVYNTQDALSRIEQDVRVSTNFMSTFNLVTSPQGRDGNTGAFLASSGDLILTQQATTSSPYDTNRSLVYYANQPNACNSPNVSSNRALMLRTVYFLDGSGTLWRRVILNPNNNNTGTSIDISSVCNPPWQRGLCPAGATLNGSPCGGYDERLIDNVTAFTVTYYTITGTVTTDPTQAKTINVQLSTSQQVAGRTIAKTGAVQVTRTNDVPTPPAAGTPIVSLYNPGLSDYNNTILTSFQWSAANAISYTIQTQVNGGSWSTPQTVTTTNISVSTGINQTASIKVTANGELGPSPTITYNAPATLFTSLNLNTANGWICYTQPSGCGSTFAPPSFTRTSAGLIVLRGLVANGATSGNIATLPNGFRPTQRSIFEVLANGYPARVDIDVDGSITLVTSHDTAYVSLDNIRFLAADTVSSLTKVAPVYDCPTGCTTAWRNYTGSGGYGTTYFMNDSIGRSYFYGLMSSSVPQPQPNNMTSSNVPSGYQVTSGYSDLYPATISNAYAASFGSYGIANMAGYSNKVMARMLTANAFKNASAIYRNASTSAGAWTGSTLANSWVNYTPTKGAGYAPASYLKDSDSLVIVRGLIAGGTVTINTKVGSLNAGYRPAYRALFLAVGTDGTKDIPVRIDVLPTGDINIGATNVMPANGFLSLAGINFYQEQ